MNFDWTDEAIERLRALFAEGLTFSQIGREIGVSRNAAIGKAHRLGLPRRGPSGPRNPKPRVAKPRQTAPAERPKIKRVAWHGPRVELVESFAPLPPPPDPDFVPPVETRKQLFELTNETCRWPCGDVGTSQFFFCGVAKADLAAGITYCPDHSAVAYNRPPRAYTPAEKEMARRRRLAALKREAAA